MAPTIQINQQCANLAPSNEVAPTISINQQCANLAPNNEVATTIPSISSGGHKKASTYFPNSERHKTRLHLPFRLISSVGRLGELLGGSGETLLAPLYITKFALKFALEWANICIGMAWVNECFG